MTFINLIQTQDKKLRPNSNRLIVHHTLTLYDVTYGRRFVTQCSVDTLHVPFW